MPQGRCNRSTPSTSNPSIPPTKPTGASTPSRHNGCRHGERTATRQLRKRTLNKTVTSCKGESNHITTLDGGAPDTAASRATVFRLPRSFSVFFEDVAVTDKEKECRRQFCRVTRCIRSLKHEKIRRMPDVPHNPQMADPLPYKPNTSHGFCESSRQSARQTVGMQATDITRALQSQATHCKTSVISACRASQH